MKIKSASYIGSYGYPQPFPASDAPEVTFVGRSNVGKSTLINTLLGRRNIARTSNTPGKTRCANFYRVNDDFCFIDMPGYGYAAASKAERARWKRLITEYLKERDALKGVVQVLDVRHEPSPADKISIERLKQMGKPFCIVFNKTDKLRRGAVTRQIASHLAGLSLDPATPVVPFSSKTGEGKRELWVWIRERLSL